MMFVLGLTVLLLGALSPATSEPQLVHYDSKVSRSRSRRFPTYSENLSYDFL